MACQTLQATVTVTARPGGSLAMDARPQQCDDFCRSYDFDPKHMVTFVTANDMETFAGNEIVAFF